MLRQMQALLAQFYDAPSVYDVDDFLTTDRQQLDLPTNCSDEQVVIAQSGDGAQLGVFIDAAVLARLAKNNPLNMLNGDNLSDFCTAFEGVSHFHYLTWRIERGIPVSLLELELQAEVDKYAGALLLLTQQQSGRFPSRLHESMFDRIEFVSELDDESAERYRLANRHAARFCRKLDERFLRVRRQRPEAWLAELRRFYRCGHAEKVRRTNE